MEAQVVVKITQDVVKFIYHSIFVALVYHTQHIVTNNSSQFIGGKFSWMCENLGICQHFSSMYRPQGNGQVEVTNKAIINRAHGLTSYVKSYGHTAPHTKHPWVTHLSQWHTTWKWVFLQFEFLTMMLQEQRKPLYNLGNAGWVTWRSRVMQRAYKMNVAHLY